MRKKTHHKTHTLTTELQVHNVHQTGVEPATMGCRMRRSRSSARNLVLQ